MKIFILNSRKLLLLTVIIISAILFSIVNTIISVSNENKEIPIYSVKRDDTKISLTFNCAWGNDDIDLILKTLNNHNVKATFFIVGDWAEKFPESLKKIAENGHEIGSHSYNHAHYNNMTYAKILADIEKCDSVIENIIDNEICLVRGGYGEYNNDVLNACKNTNRTYIQWSLDSIDYKAKSVDYILNRLVPNVKNGDIILMHTGTDYTASSLDALLSELSKNHELVTVSELIYKDDFTIDHSGCQIPNQK